MWTFEELTFLAFVLFQLQGLTLKLQSLKIKKNLFKKRHEIEVHQKKLCTVYLYYVLCTSFTV